ncbi:MAG: hypothetical protein HC854_11910 [Flavobacterium sp.]|nr:hypothetical protein [Flavobacterium sp.]
MKNKFLILIMLSLTLFIGCKDEKSTEQPVVEKVVNLVKVSVTATVTKEDNFQLFTKRKIMLRFHLQNKMQCGKK